MYADTRRAGLAKKRCLACLKYRAAFAHLEPNENNPIAVALAEWEPRQSMATAKADQIHRLVKSGADVSIVQHCHLIGEVVRETLRNFTVRPGGGLRKYCLIDGQATYRILKAYSLLSAKPADE